MNEKQLANYRMNSEELAEWNSLAKQICEDCNRADIMTFALKDAVTKPVFPTNIGSSI